MNATKELNEKLKLKWNMMNSQARELKNEDEEKLKQKL